MDAFGVSFGQILVGLLTGGVAVKALDVLASRRAADVPLLAEAREWTRDANARADALAKRVDEAEAEAAAKAEAERQQFQSKLDALSGELAEERRRLSVALRDLAEMKRLLRSHGITPPGDTPPSGTPAAKPEKGDDLR